MSVVSLESVTDPAFTCLDAAVAELVAARRGWARTGIDARLAILAAIRVGIMTVAEDWALTAARAKQIPARRREPGTQEPSDVTLGSTPQLLGSGFGFAAPE